MRPEPLSDESPAPEPAGDARPLGERIYGVIDVLRGDRIAGWAIDRSNSAAALDVDILRDGAVIRTVRADRQRPDLQKGGIGTGAYGFRAEIEPAVEAGFEFTLTAVARAPDGASAPLSRVGAAQRAVDPSLRLLERIYGEVCRSGVAANASAATPANEARLSEALARIEVVQARLEAALSALDAHRIPRRDRSLGLVVAATVALAATSLGVGLASLWLS